MTKTSSNDKGYITLTSEQVFQLMDTVQGFRISGGYFFLGKALQGWRLEEKIAHCTKKVRKILVQEGEPEYQFNMVTILLPEGDIIIAVTSAIIGG